MLSFFIRPDLPSALAGWSAFDLLVIEREELQALKVDDPNRFALLRRWLFAGGNLITTEGGDDFAQRGEIEDLLETPRDDRMVSQPYVDTHRSWSGWRHPQKRRYGRMSNRLRTALRNNEKLDDVEKQLRDIPEESPFLIRPFGLGQLVVLGGGTDQSTLVWNWVIRSLPAESHDWKSRNGLTMTGGNDGFWDFLIPGVGLPPVVAFCRLDFTFCRDHWATKLRFAEPYPPVDLADIYRSPGRSFDNRRVGHFCHDDGWFFDSSARPIGDAH